MDSNVINRLKEYCMKHQELMQSGVIKGINSNTNEIVLEKNGVQKNVSMDILENNKFDFDKFEIIPDMIEEDEEVETIEEMVEEPQETINVPKTMADLNEAIKNKDEKAVDKALETFAINEKTGVIDVNNAISTVTNNAIKEAVGCIKNNKAFDNDMSKYDVRGRKMAENNYDASMIQAFEGQDAVKEATFNSFIVPYIEIAKMKGYGANFTEKVILNAKNRYNTMINDSLNFNNLALKGYNKTDEKVQQKESEKTNELVENQSNALTLKPEPMLPMKKAGFADALILTIIVLVYAAIIINLILKLK